MADLESFRAWVADASATLTDQAEHLTDLDRAIGDGDHGTNMARGFAACAALDPEAGYNGIDAYLKMVGMTLVSTVGGASGPLYGTFFLRLAGPLAAADEVGVHQVGQALRAGVEGVVARGKAQLGDKTMYDALAPALEAFDEASRDGQDLASCLEAAALAAAAGRDATEPLVARKGRASYLGERSAGHIDPGASSATLLIEAAARTLV
ncbi:dihydroxyacetone kinase subunit DhaL [Ornithinimicrobium cerasi]|uniref:Dihydroxyacetone kinase DhaL subunit n=1 Tax=Ornithinimicrobium cerasi TaxID=2248773 RepID=A0A285VLL5_9MICO|nr:dihydroxyacetone kinase subunit DhaL [Ornithinimicrobium cerasi]SOC54980.1 dihydroxyacetone kinase DhaL subunit [Ornithinimicrobium cerasi]